MLKPFTPPQILAVEDYYELFGKPREDMNVQDETILKKFIAQATDQFDSLISPYNQNGVLYNFWNNLQDTPLDNQKGYKLQKAIGSWVETMIIAGKFWVDNIPTMQSNIDYDITSKANDSRIENKRQDIIQDLVSIGLTKTSNIGGNEISNTQQQELEKNFLREVQEWAYATFLALDNYQKQGGLLSNTDYNANSLLNTGNLNAAFVGLNKYELQNYKLRNCDINFKDGNNLNVENTNKILDPTDGMFKFINQFTANYFGGLSKEEIYLAIQASGSLWQPQFIYQKGFVVMYKINDVDLYGYWESLIDNNTNNNPTNSPDAWKQLPSSPTDINAVIVAVKEYVDTKYQEQTTQLTNEIVPNEVKSQLNALPTIDYVSEGLGETIEFATQQDYEDYKIQMNVDDTYFEEQNYNEVGIFENTTSFNHDRNMTVRGQPRYDTPNTELEQDFSFYHGDNNQLFTTLPLNNNFNDKTFLRTIDFYKRIPIFRFLTTVNYTITNLEILTLSYPFTRLNGQLLKISILAREGNNCYEIPIVRRDKIVNQPSIVFAQCNVYGIEYMEITIFNHSGKTIEGEMVIEAEIL